MSQVPYPPHGRARSGRRRVFAFLVGTLVLAAVLSGVAAAATVGPFDQFTGGDNQAVIVEPEAADPPAAPDELELETFTNEDFSVDYPAEWQAGVDEEGFEEGYNAYFDDTEGSGFRLSYIQTDPEPDSVPDAMAVLESVEEGRAEDFDGYQQVRLEETEQDALPTPVGAAALAESEYTVSELDHLVGGFPSAERFRIQLALSDGQRLHSLLIMGPVSERENYVGLVEEIFDSFQVHA